ncbi:MAG: DNA mismatch repair endonuclease MutL [Phycisphaerae bacterium]
MSKIKILPVHLVNKIAAGECIERPASVIKELVENSIDAGATKIDVYIEQGGTKVIRVTDNGAGIDTDDLPLAVTPHATSKLQDENDLYAISTMGFRGEALTSIGSVAVLKIASIMPSRESGGQIEVGDGHISEVRPYAGASGTTIEVDNLFFNTPARRKFLKSPQTELGHCQEAVIRLALAYPTIGFTLSHANRRILQLPAAESPRTRINDIFGPEIGDGLIQVFTQSKDITFSAYVSRPQQAKPSANWQYFFVNRRAIRDRYITHALREAYRGLMPQDRQPVGFLFLEIDPSIVDVNVHPTKSEVRFADSGRIHSLVLGAIRERFLSVDLTAGLNMRDTKPQGLEVEEKTTPHQETIKEALNDFLKSAPKSDQARIPFTHHTPDVTITKRRDREEADILPSPTERVLQIHNSYLVVETAEGMMIVDQHALHERILYQQMRGRVNAGAVPRQKLLMPELVNLTPDEMEQIEQIRPSLNQAGVEVEAFGPQTAAIHSLPAVISHLNATEFIEELLTRLGKTAKVEPEQVLEHVLQSLACKAAIKAGDPLKPDEIQSLLASRNKVDMASSCPHGRPTVLQMSLSDLQKQFKRT